MSDIILHHYEGSPFARKARLILGWKGLSWHSVLIPAIMPKPDLTALTGGYRRTPVMQMGADIYCDTALIAQVLDDIAPEKMLFPEQSPFSVDALAQWADTQLFNFAIALAFQQEVFSQMFQGNQDMMVAFFQDRKKMNQGAPQRQISVGEANAFFAQTLPKLEAQLADGRLFLVGDTPCIVDFSTYHPLWFIQTKPIIHRVFEPYPHIQQWLTRMSDFGEGSPTRMSGQDALATSKSSTPISMPAQSDLEQCPVGSLVTVAAADYGQDPTAGTLVSADAQQVVIAREDERAGLVHVHFPLLKYNIRPTA
jgi:glutathione S-transferase